MDVAVSERVAVGFNEASKAEAYVHVVVQREELGKGLHDLWARAWLRLRMWFGFGLGLGFGFGDAPRALC